MVTKKKIGEKVLLGKGHHHIKKERNSGFIISCAKQNSIQNKAKPSIEDPRLKSLVGNTGKTP